MMKTRIVVVGLGGRGMWAVLELAGNADYELVAIVDRNQAKIDAAHQHEVLKLLPGYRSISECLASEAFDAVAVATHDGAHAEVVIPCLDAGKYVFVEKPLEITAEKCRTIVDADRNAGGKTFVGFNLRFAPVYVKIKQLIDQGAIGRVLTIQADEFYDGGRTYFRRWNRLRAFGGGLWITKASHDFDLLFWFAGCKPLSIYALSQLSYYNFRPEVPLHCFDCALNETCPDVGQTAQNARVGDHAAETAEVVGSGENADTATLCLFNADKDTFDHGIATVEFENGILATYTCNVISGFSNRRIRVSGTKGTLDGSLDSEHVILHQRDPARQTSIELASAVGPHGGGDRMIFQSFRDFVQGHKASCIAPEEAMIPVLLGLAATRSGDEKRRVELAEFEL